MTNNSLIRLLSFGLPAVLYAAVLGAQATPPSMESASPAVTPPAAASPVAAVAEMPPPKAPIVTCDKDQLTISADNSTLRSVLAAVHACIGVQIDFPEGADGGRTFEQLGPGPARQVLASLLSGSEFNYVIGSSDKNPQKVETVLLILRTTEAQSPSDTDRSLTPARRAWELSRQNGKSRSSSGNESNLASDEASTVPPSDDVATAPIENSSTNATGVPVTGTPVSVTDTHAPVTGTPVPVTDTPAPAADTTVPPATSAVPSASPEGAASPASAAVGAPAGASASSDQGTDISDKINNMEQMFEQRRKVTQSQNTSTPQP